MTGASTIGGLAIRLALAALVLAGCARRTPFLTPADFEHEYVQIGALELAATVERDESDVYGTVELMNTGPDTVRLEYNAYCDLAIVLFREKDRRLLPRWDSATWWRGRGGYCPERPLQLDIPPATLARIVAPAVEARGILGDSLPAGEYITAMRVRMLQPRDTALVLPGGVIQLEPGESGGLMAAGR